MSTTEDQWIIAPSKSRPCQMRKKVQPETGTACCSRPATVLVHEPRVSLCTQHWNAFKARAEGVEPRERNA